jgi:uncharacterized membrane protein
VNDNGEIVGFDIDSANNFQGFSYVSNGTYATISCAQGTSTRAYGIDDAGAIVGDYSNSTSGPFSGFAYKSGQCTAIDYPSAVSTGARGINKSNQISGWYEDSSSTYHGFVKAGANFSSLSYPEAIGTLAYHINDMGQVAGFYTDAAGATHGFVATPKK